MEVRIINKRYRLIEKLGEGGMGSVYLVEDILQTNRQIALKIIKKEIINLSTLKSFKQEFDVMTRLKHPNLTQVYDFGLDKEEDVYHITMEYVQGISLSDLLKQKKKISEKQALNIIVSLCRTLEFIHSRKILHRDIKPGNIMIQELGIRSQELGIRNQELGIKGEESEDNFEIKVMDFGLSDLSQSENQYLTKGTLSYIAPEVLRGEIDHKVDIYASGITFYELLTGDTLYGEHQSKSIISALRNKTEFSKNVNIALEKIKNSYIRKIIEKMIAYNPINRYQFISEVILDINDNLNTSYNLETDKTKTAYVLGAGFVGRKEELSKLKEKLESIENNKMLLVEGTTGVGKSRLYQEFRKYCQLNDIVFVEASCSEQIAKTYAPFMDILNELLLNTEEDLIEKYAPELKKILPYHNRFKEIKVNSSYDPKTERGVLIQNITNFLLEHSKQQKTKIAIYLNDLQWSDEASLSVLEELMYKLSQKESNEENNNLIIYSSIREEEISNVEIVLSKLENKNRLEKIILKPFSVSDVGNYIEAVFGENYIDDSLKNAISVIGEKVGGNPFFLQELIKSLVENGYIIRDKLKWKLTHSIDKIEIPNNLKTILKTKLDKLDLTNQERKSLEILALLNKNVTIDIFEQILISKTDFNILAFFIELMNKEFLISEEIEDKIEYNFIHALTREVIVEGIENNEELHQHIAERLENIYKDNINEYIEDLAYHYNQTDSSTGKEKAILYLEKAGDNARTNYANEKAINYYEQLLNRLEEEEKEKRINIFVKKGNILELIGKWDFALSIYQDALKLSEEIDNKFLIGKSKNVLGKILQMKGNYKEAFKLFESALETFTLLVDKQNIANVLNDMGFIYYRQGNYEKTMEYCKKALQIVEELGDKNGIRTAMHIIGNIYISQCDYEKAMECYQRSLKIFEELGDKRGIINLINNMGIVYYSQGNYEKTMEYFQRSLEFSKELGNKRGISMAIGNIGNIYYEQGNYEKAMKYYQKSLKIKEELGIKQGIGIDIHNIGDIYKKLNEYTQAEKHYNKAIAITRELQSKYLLCEFLCSKTDLCFILKRWDEAKILNEESINIAKEIEQPDMLFKTNLLSIKIEFYQSDIPSNKASAINKLKDILKEIKSGENEEQIAILNYELYNTTQETKYAQKALELYQKLYKKIPKMDYEEKSEELEKGLLENKKNVQTHKIKKETIQYNQDTDSSFSNSYEELHTLLTTFFFDMSKKIRQLERSTDIE